MKQSIKFILASLVSASIVSCASPGSGCYDFSSVDDSHKNHESLNIDKTDSRLFICVSSRP